MSPLPFSKYHGLGNDFVVLDGLDGRLPLATLTEPAMARELCDRHRGIGADGLLLVLPSPVPEARARMRVINADGSESEMCGNGIRCVAKYLRDRVPAFAGMAEVPIHTGAGVLRCAVTLSDTGRVRSVRVDMGRPTLDRPHIPMTGAGQFVEDVIEVAGRSLRATAVSMGNPHLVTFLDDGGEDLAALAATLGPALERHPAFPQRTNVEFARPLPEGGLELSVWERGCGLTLACGTGACATAVAAVVTGRHAAGRPLRVRLPGGPLEILVAEGLERVYMDGPATEVFAGEVALPT